jgi:hypothetical protein
MKHQYHAVGNTQAAGHHGRGRFVSLVLATVAAHALAVCSFALTTFAMRHTHGSLQLGTFANHPFLMSFAFAVCLTFGVLSYATYERILGVSHATAKCLHFAWHTVALGAALTGFGSMYFVHAQSGHHFLSLHSWLGVLVLAAFSLQYVMGVVLYFGPCVADDLKRFMMPAHVFIGTASLFGTYAVILLGLIYNNPGVNGDQSAFLSMNWAGVSLFLMVRAIATSRAVGRVLNHLHLSLLGTGAAPLVCLLTACSDWRGLRVVQQNYSSGRRVVLHLLCLSDDA